MISLKIKKSEGGKGVVIGLKQSYQMAQILNTYLLNFVDDFMKKKRFMITVFRRVFTNLVIFE